MKPLIVAAAPARVPVPTKIRAETVANDEAIASQYSTKIIRREENDMRIDRWLRQTFPTLTQSFIEKLLRKKQARYQSL